MDLDLATYLVTAAKAWGKWSKSKKTVADQLALGLAVSAVGARAKIVWTSNPNYPQIFEDIADIALQHLQDIIDHPKETTAKEYSDALVRTVIVEKTRDRLEKEGYVDESPWSQAIWLNLSKVSPALLLYAWATDKIKAQDIVDDVQGTVLRIRALAGSGSNTVLWIVGTLAGVYLLGQVIGRK